MRRFLTSFFLYLQLAACFFMAQAQFPVTFDGLSPGNDYFPLPSGYGNLQWLNFYVIKGANRPVTEGYRTGMVSPNNVAFNPYGTPASFHRSGTFNLVSAYLTAAFQPGLQVRVRGYIGTNVLYDQTYVLNPTSPVFAEFNYLGVDRVSFVASPESIFVVDNLTIAPVLTNGSCAVATSPADGVYGSNSDTGTVSVATSSDCTWTVLNSNTWITILSASTNTGNATLLYHVQTNGTGLPRSGFVDIAANLLPSVRPRINPRTPPR